MARLSAALIRLCALPPISPAAAPVSDTLTPHELAVRQYLQEIIGDLCEVKYIDNFDYIDFVISNLSENELRNKDGVQRARDSRDCVFCVRYGKMDRGTDVHPQDGNFKNAALTFFHANENSSDLKTKIQNANKEFRRGNNGWISVQIDSDDDIKALEDAIKYWFDFRKSEFNRRQEPERVCETGQCND